MSDNFETYFAYTVQIYSGLKPKKNLIVAIIKIILSGILRMNFYYLIHFYKTC